MRRASAPGRRISPRRADTRSAGRGVDGPPQDGQHALGLQPERQRRNPNDAMAARYDELGLAEQVVVPLTGVHVVHAVHFERQGPPGADVPLLVELAAAAVHVSAHPLPDWLRQSGPATKPHEIDLAHRPGATLDVAQGPQHLLAVGDPTGSVELAEQPPWCGEALLNDGSQHAAG